MTCTYLAQPPKASLSPFARQTLLQLWCMPDIGPKSIQILLPLVLNGWDPSQVLDLAHVNLPVKQQKALKNVKNQNSALMAVKKMLDWEAQDERHHLIVLPDSYYPALLKEIAAPPPVLMIKGHLAALNGVALGMVGSRNPSVEGKKNAQLFAEYLVDQGVVIISGGAAGVDKVCHQAALQSGGQTVAVLGHGLDKCYPSGHQSLYAEISENGALVSEFPLGTSPRPQFFPRRNRIITGLSLGVCVVEAGLPSGSLVSARWAYEQNREVFAIPGSIHNPRTKGCHMLIQQGAKLVQSGEDILSELRYLVPEKPSDKKLVFDKEPDVLEDRIIFHVQSCSRSMDELAELLSDISVQELSSCLTMMEISGQLKREPATGLFVLFGV